jgi:transcriptional regulator with XRE-family HTH domain
MSNAAGKNTDIKIVSNGLEAGEETVSDIDAAEAKDTADAQDIADQVDVADTVAAVAAPHLVVVTPDALNAERMGPRMKAAREAKGWSLEAAARETRIHRDYISAIEDMMPNLLPGMPKSQSYLRGYLNNYAKSLGLPDPKDVVQRYLSECGLLALEMTEEERIAKEAKIERSRKTAWVAPVLASVMATITVCAIVGAYIFQPWKSGVESAPNVAAAATGTVGTVIPAEAGSPVRAMTMSLFALQRAWVEIRGADGTIYLSKEMAPGEVYVPRTGAGWTITARDGGSFEWRSNGQSYGTVAEAGLPVYAISVDEVLSRDPLPQNDLLH